MCHLCLFSSQSLCVEIQTSICSYLDNILTQLQQTVQDPTTCQNCSHHILTQTHNISFSNSVFTILHIHPSKIETWGTPNPLFPLCHSVYHQVQNSLFSKYISNLSCSTLQMEKRMATHTSILAWRIPWTEEPGGLQSMGLQKSRI